VLGGLGGCVCTHTFFNRERNSRSLIRAGVIEVPGTRRNFRSWIRHEAKCQSLERKRGKNNSSSLLIVRSSHWTSSWSQSAKMFWWGTYMFSPKQGREAGQRAYRERRGRQKIICILELLTFCKSR
jgi:hypothetical protein